MRKIIIGISGFIFLLGLGSIILKRNGIILWLDVLTPVPISAYLIFLAVVLFYGSLLVDTPKTVKVVSSAFMGLFVLFFWTITLLVTPASIPVQHSDWVITKHSFFFNGTYRIYKQEGLIFKEQFSCEYIDDQSFCTIDSTETHIEIRYGNYGEAEQIKIFYFEED